MDSIVVTTCQQALLAVLILSAPAALTAVLVGLVVSVLQTATQIQEQTLSYVPKLVAVSAALAVAGPWMLAELIRLATSMFERVAEAM
ncbi:MAG: type III secretion system export apparatus subunit SctS [Acidobacteria bacterium]|nr:type III secretion system export apparatus subunit SctS [Acidobacteriota bacterium]